MSLQERSHAGILRKLGSQRHEPYLGIDVGVAELIDLAQLFVHLNGGRRGGRSRFVCKLLGAEVRVLHTAGRERAAMPRTEMSTIVRVLGNIVSIEIVVEAVLGLLTFRLHINRLRHKRLRGIQLAFRLQGRHHLRRSFVCHLLVNCIVALILALLVMLFLEAFPAAAGLAYSTRLELFVNVKPILRSVLLFFLVAMELIKEATEARLRHLHISRACKSARLGEIVLVSGIIGIVHVHVLRVHGLHQLSAHGSERARCACRAKRSLRSIHARLRLGNISSFDSARQRGKGRKQGRMVSLLPVIL